jgi:hypothetical protein
MGSFLSGLFALNDDNKRLQPPSQAQASASPQQAPSGDLIKQTIAQYPGIGKALQGVAFRASPADKSRMLEFYPQGERDSFDPSKPAIEVFGDKAKPQDIAGDFVSHHLANGGDPVVTKAYQDFEKSLTSSQKARLQEQYKWAQANEGEKRSFQEWYKASGLPAYFRGYAFGQWPNPEKLYTPEQMNSFDKLNTYLRGGK